MTEDVWGSVGTVPCRAVVVLATRGRQSISSPMLANRGPLSPLASCWLRSCPWGVSDPTILLLTNSSMALTSSAALGVSELEGRTERREDVCTRERDRRRVRGYGG